MTTAPADVVRSGARNGSRLPAQHSRVAVLRRRWRSGAPEASGLLCVSRCRTVCVRFPRPAGVLRRPGDDPPGIVAVSLSRRGAGLRVRDLDRNAPCLAEKISDRSRASPAPRSGVDRGPFAAWSRCAGDPLGTCWRSRRGSWGESVRSWCPAPGAPGARLSAAPSRGPRGATTRHPAACGVIHSVIRSPNRSESLRLTKRAGLCALW